MECNLVQGLVCWNVCTDDHISNSIEPDFAYCSSKYVTDYHHHYFQDLTSFVYIKFLDIISKFCTTHMFEIVLHRKFVVFMIHFCHSAAMIH